MTNKQKRHIIASVGTVLFMLLLFLLLWFIYLTAVVPEEEEGIEVAFGEVEEAGGYMAEQSEAVPMPSPEPAAPKQPTAPTVEEHITTDDPEALALAEAKKKREAEEKARLEAEKRKREQEEAKKDSERKKAQDIIGGLNFGQSGNDTGSGDNQGSGQKGNPAGGEGVYNGNRYSLKGRVPMAIPDPEGYFNENAKVVVQIRVNANGDVIYAKSTTGTQTANTAIIRMAEEAARKSKWDAQPGAQDQVGTIEYNFIIK